MTTTPSAAGGGGQETAEALAFLCGLHPEVAIDGPPMAVANLIFDFVLAERSALKDRIKALERNLESLRAHFAAAGASQ